MVVKEEIIKNLKQILDTEEGFENPFFKEENNSFLSNFNDITNQNSEGMFSSIYTINNKLTLINDRGDILEFYVSGKQIGNSINKEGRLKFEYKYNDYNTNIPVACKGALNISNDGISIIKYYCSFDKKITANFIIEKEYDKDGIEYDYYYCRGYNESDLEKDYSNYKHDDFLNMIDCNIGYGGSANNEKKYDNYLTKSYKRVYYDTKNIDIYSYNKGIQDFAMNEHVQLINPLNLEQNEAFEIRKKSIEESMNEIANLKCSDIQKEALINNYLKGRDLIKSNIDEEYNESSETIGKLK